MKLPQFYTAFSAAASKTVRPHRDTLPKPPEHWRGLLKHPHAEGFKKAADIEYNALLAKNTWKVKPKRSGLKLLPIRWVFTYKFDEAGYLIKYKARLVARGDLQEATGQDVYAATLAFKMFRTLMALMAAYGLDSRQMDAINAFLNVLMQQPVYCQMPEGFTRDNSMLEVWKALYGIRKSPLYWLQMLSGKYIELGLYQIPGKPCLFTDYHGIFLFFYIDDIAFIFKVERAQDIEKLITRLKAMFKMRDLGRIKWFLNVRVIHDKDANKVYLCQDSYINKLITDYDVDTKANPPPTPLPAEELKVYEGEIDLQHLNIYRKKVGSICYPAVITRPDIAKAASKLSEFLVNPGPQHLAAADHCMRYLYGTKYLGIGYSASGGGELTVKAPETSTDAADAVEIFEATADASFANCAERRSAEGYTFKLYGGMIDWAARKQLTVSTSTTEAELLALLHAGKETLWWMNLFDKLNLDLDHPVTIYNDNLQTLRILTSESPKLDTRLRHVDVCQSWLRQVVQITYLNVGYLPTAKMVADGLTKLLPAQKHQTFIKQLGLIDLEDLIDELRFEEEEM